MIFFYYYYLFIYLFFQLFSVFVGSNKCQIFISIIIIIIIIIIFNVSIGVVDNAIQRFYAIWCPIINVVEKNTLVWFPVSLDVTRITIFNIDHIIEKLAHKIFYIDFSFSAHLYTNIIIRMELLIHVSHNT